MYTPVVNKCILKISDPKKKFTKLLWVNLMGVDVNV